MPTGADLVAGALADAGVEVAFGLPGAHNLALWRAVDGTPLRIVGTRHEQAAAAAADGYARASGHLGVALVTTGPGAANTLGAVGEAWASGTPLLVVATDIATTLRRPGAYRGALHETTDQAAMFAPVTKATVRVAKPAELYAAVQMAVFTATDAPTRPVYLEVPTDLLSADVGDGYLRADIEDTRLRLPDQDDAVAAARLLRDARRPLVWAGGGALRAGAGPAVAQLAERLTAPVVTTFGARGLLGASHPCAVELPPHIPEVGALWDDADVVVAVGTDFDGMMTQNWRQPAPQALVTVNLDAADAAKAYPPTVSLVADARVGTETLADLLDPAADDAVQKLGARLADLRAQVRADLAEGQPQALAFLDGVAEALPPDATVLADMCIPGYWYAGFGAVAGPRRLAHPVGWGTLGFAFPAALGAALGAPGPVLSISGDGGFLMASGELATAAQEDLALTALVVDDGGYGMLRFDPAGLAPPAGVDLLTPDFAALAGAFGVPADTVDGFGHEFRSALRSHLARPGPSLLAVRARLAPPATTSPRWYRSAHAS